jgi:hypothetical protein
MMISLGVFLCDEANVIDAALRKMAASPLLQAFLMPSAAYAVCAEMVCGPNKQKRNCSYCSHALISCEA